MNTSQLIQDVMDGTENPLRALALLKSEAESVKLAIIQIEDYAFQEAMKYGEKTFQDMGYRFTLTDGRRTYDFKHIQEWRQADSIKRDIEAKYKAALDNIDKGLMAISSEGEELDLPKVSYSKSSISVRQL